MPWWMRYAKQEEASDGTGTGEAAAGGAGAGTGGAADSGDAPASQAEPIEIGMAAAIRSHLAPAEQGAPDSVQGATGQPERVRDPATGRFLEKPAVEAAPQATAPKVDAKQATVDPTKPDPTKPLAPKKADDFALKPEEKSSLTPNAQRRVHDIHKEWKAAESQWDVERTTLAQQNQVLQQARDSIMGVLEETKTTPEALTQLLGFNQLVTSGNLQGALEMVEQYRSHLYAALGKEAPGVDLLKDYPDLSQRVANNEIHRDDAVAIANARRRDQHLQQQGQQQFQQQQQVQSIQKQQDDAMTSIDRWSQAVAQKDIDWPGKEAKIIAKLDAIVKRYPPNLWLQRLQEEYESTPAAPQQRIAEVPGTGSNIPLRASGTRGGLPQPATMEEAVFRKLGITS